MLSPKEVWKDFAEKTTVSGLFFIAKYERLSLKLLWTVIFIGLVSVTSYQSYLCVQKYLRQPITVKTTVSLKNQK